MKKDPDTMKLAGLLFDKDGTLFDFQATWGGWAADLVLNFAGGDEHRADRLADLILLDRAAARFHAGSPVIAGTTEEAVDALKPGLPELTSAEIMTVMVERSRLVEPIEATPLDPLLRQLASAGHGLGVATNDIEIAARDQLNSLGVLEQFDFVVGADSGHGAKPAPGQCLAFAEVTGLPPARIAMIGDSTHDLLAGQAAGMVTVGVLTGPATRGDLEPFATVVLPDIGHLPAWLAAR